MVQQGQESTNRYYVIIEGKAAIFSADQALTQAGLRMGPDQGRGKHWWKLKSRLTGVQ